MRSRTLLWIFALAALLAVVVVIRLAGSEKKTNPGGAFVTSSTSAETPRVRSEPSASARTSATVATSPSGDASPSSVAVVSARWGSADGELGRKRPQEGNPEGPMSFAVSGDELVVVDQVNTRVVRYDRRGRMLGTAEAPPTVQDVAIAGDGTLALLDRLVGKNVTLTDARGHKIGVLPLSGVDPGLTTGLFVDGKDVYVEAEHGALVRVGSTDGATSSPGELSGRPSRDGALLLTAGITSSREGRAFVNAFDRKKEQLRFARALELARPIRSIVLLDSDARGAIYFGAAAGPGNAAHVMCLDPSDGHVLARAVLPLSETAEESFRDFSVSPDGAIVFAVRAESGVEYRSVSLSCGG